MRENIPHVSICESFVRLHVLFLMLLLKTSYLYFQSFLMFIVIETGEQERGKETYIVDRFRYDVFVCFGEATSDRVSFFF